MGRASASISHVSGTLTEICICVCSKVRLLRCRIYFVPLTIKTSGRYGLRPAFSCAVHEGPVWAGKVVTYQHVTLLCDATVAKKRNGLVMAKPTDKELLETGANESAITGPGIDQKIIRRVFWEYYSGLLKALFEDRDAGQSER